MTNDPVANAIDRSRMAYWIQARRDCGWPEEDLVNVAIEAMISRGIAIHPEDMQLLWDDAQTHITQDASKFER